MFPTWLVAIDRCSSLPEEHGGYQNLDGHAIKESLDSIKDFDAYSIRKITYATEDRKDSEAIRLYQVQVGEVIPLTDWREAPMLVP
jgi:hypothetical protein